MPVKHVFNSAIADGGDATLVRPSNWNADHLSIPVQYSFSNGGTSTNMPAADTEWRNTAFRLEADLTNATQFNLQFPVTTAGFAGADIRAQYTTDLTGATGWTNLDGVNGPEIDIGTTGLKNTGWVTLATAARTTVLLRIMGKQGNGTIDPNTGTQRLQVK